MPQLLIDLTDEDGADLGRMPLADFLRDNDIHEREDVETIEEVLYAGRAYTGGGGAAPEWTIRRVPEQAPRFAFDPAQLARGRELIATATIPTPLPSRRIDADLGRFEVAKWLTVARTGDGFALVTEAKFYDRHGEKDEREEVISRHATLEAAAAAFDAYPARAQAVAA